VNGASIELQEEKHPATSFHLHYVVILSHRHFCEKRRELVFPQLKAYGQSCTPWAVKSATLFSIITPVFLGDFFTLFVPVETGINKYSTEELKNLPLYTNCVTPL